jgi:hypothetical protein
MVSTVNTGVLDCGTTQELLKTDSKVFALFSSPQLSPFPGPSWSVLQPPRHRTQQKLYLVPSSRSSGVLLSFILLVLCLLVCL